MDDPRKQCRLCYTLPDEEIDLYLKPRKNSNHAAALLDLLHIPLEQRSEWPRVACSPCIEFLSQIRSFRDKVNATQALLLNVKGMVEELPPIEDVVPRKRGRPPKRETSQVSETFFDDDWQASEHSDAEEEVAADYDQKEEEKSEVLPRKRGRPPKRESSQVNETFCEEDWQTSEKPSDAKDIPAAEEQKEKEEAVVLPRKRGRPPKAFKVTTKPAQKVTPVRLSLANVNEGEQPKKRGRPRKRPPTPEGDNPLTDVKNIIKSEEPKTKSEVSAPEFVDVSATAEEDTSATENSSEDSNSDSDSGDEFVPDEPRVSQGSQGKRYKKKGYQSAEQWEQRYVKYAHLEPALKRLNLTTCRKCGEQFETFLQMVQHSFLKHRIGRGHTYVRCCESNLTVHTVYDHALFHENPDIFACKVCGKKCKSRRQLEHRHMRIHGPREHGFRCEKCNRGFYEANKYKVHKERCKKCPHCDKHFTCDKLMEGHIDMRHTELTCEVCGMSVLGGMLKAHLLRHTMKKTLTECDLCGKYYLNIEKHKRLHTSGAVAVKQPCTICGVMLARKCMPRHMLTKHGVGNAEKHPCTYCDKVFGFRANLQKHLYIHQGVRFPCFFCSETYGDPSNRTKHMQKKHAEEYRRYLVEQSFEQKKKLLDDPERIVHAPVEEVIEYEVLELN